MKLSISSFRIKHVLLFVISIAEECLCLNEFRNSNISVVTVL